VALLRSGLCTDRRLTAALSILGVEPEARAA
jgi:hypothetical protein